MKNLINNKYSYRYSHSRNYYSRSYCNTLKLNKSSGLN